MQIDVREISRVIDARLERGEVPGFNFPAEWWPVVADVLRHAARQTDVAQRHRDRFAALSADERPEMPEGYEAPLPEYPLLHRS